MKILVLIEDLQTREKIKSILEKYNYFVKAYSDVNNIFDGLFKEYDIYIIGFKFNEYTGLEIISYIKNVHNNANILLSVKNQELENKKFLLDGIEKITLPLNKDILLSKITNIKSTSIYTLSNGLTYDAITRNLFSIENHRIKLTKKEALLFHLLVTNIGTYISKEQIELYVFNGNCDITELEEISISNSTIRGLIFRLRKKLPMNTILTETSKDSYFIPNDIK